VGWTVCREIHISQPFVPPVVLSRHELPLVEPDRDLGLQGVQNFDCLKESELAIRITDME
jgi:hypothetical protein